MTKKLTRKPRNRLEGYDYSQSNYYYVTICTYSKKEWFGKIENNQMALNYQGQIVEQQWQWLAKQYSYVELDEYVVMPNHIHGILIIDDADRSRPVPTYYIKSLSSLIGAFKTTSSKKISFGDNYLDFQWLEKYFILS